MRLYFDPVLVVGENSLSGHVNKVVFIDRARLFLQSLIDSALSCAVPWSDQSCLFQGPVANVSLELLDLQQEYVQVDHCAYQESALEGVENDALQ